MGEGGEGHRGVLGEREGRQENQDAREKQMVRRLSETKLHCQGGQGEEEKEENSSRWEHLDCHNHKRFLMVMDTSDSNFDAAERCSGPQRSTRIHICIATQTLTEGHPLGDTTT